MHLLLIIPHFSARVGGAEGFAVTVMRGLAERGHRITVLAQDGEELPGLALERVAPAAVEARSRGLGADLILDWGLTVLADIHRLGGGVHAEFLRYNRMGCGLVGGCWRTLEAHLLPRHCRTIARERRLLQAPGTHLLAVSNFVADQVRRCVPVAADRIRVLHNGVDVDRFTPARNAAERDAARQALGLTPGQVAFLFVGHNLRLKNLALLEAVFRQLAPTRPELRLVVVGKRRPRFAAPWLVYAGQVQSPERVYGAADVLLHPTYYDACANVVLEGLACGLPVVSSDQNGSAEVIEPGVSGLVLGVAGPRSQVEGQWREAVARLATAPDLRHDLGQAARHLAQRHSIALYVDRFEAYIEEVAHAKAGE